MTQVTLGGTQLRLEAQFSAAIQAGWCISVANLFSSIQKGVCDEQIYVNSVLAGNGRLRRLRLNER